MRKSSALALLAIFLAAVWIRLSPLLSFEYWGSDIGEYYVLLNRLATTGYISTTYYGWGITYPYFPGMFFVQNGLLSLSSIGVPSTLNLVIPILGAVAVVPAYLIAVAITKESKVGLFLAAFVAVAMPHAYATSHTSPATLGDLFVFTSLVLFIRLRRDPKALALLVLASAALIMTHHLAAYFLILVVVATIFFHGLVRPVVWSAPLQRELAYATFLVLATFAFWFGYATTFRDGILHDVNVQPWYLLLLAFPVILAAMAILVLARRQSAWRYHPRVPGLRREVLLYGVTLVFTLGLVAYASIFTIPGTTITLSLNVPIAFAPFVALLALSASGRKFLDFLKDGFPPTAWMLALLASIAAGAVAAPRVIIPYRHIEYLLLPLGLFAGVGLFRMLDLADLRGIRRAGVLAVCGLLLLATAAVAIPPPDLLVQWQEGTRPPAIDLALWSRDDVEGLLAADHRASTLAFGFGGVDATWDRARAPFLADSFDESRAGFLNVETPSGTKDVAYVWIDADTERGVQLYPWEPASAMSPQAIAKFSESPFVKVFDNGFGQIYRVAWGCDSPC